MYGLTLGLAINIRSVGVQPSAPPPLSCLKGQVLHLLHYLYLLALEHAVLFVAAMHDTILGASYYNCKKN